MDFGLTEEERLLVCLFANLCDRGKPCSMETSMAGFVGNDTAT